MSDSGCDKMPEKKTDRISVRMPLDRVEEIKAAAEAAGVSVSAFGGMVLWIGFKLYQLQVDPINSLTDDQLLRLKKISEKGRSDG